MKNLKYGILAFGVLGLIGLVMADVFKGFESDAFNTILVLAGFGVPAAVGALALKGQAQAWHGAAALGGFALVVVKLRAWDMIKIIGLLPMGFKLALVAAIGGLVVSLIALIKPEAKA